MGRFTEQSLSDQKRLARGEHLLAARTHLRARDGVHHRRWAVLMLAGDSPKGEITALRALMPKCRIVAVDNDPQCVEAAIDAGADDVVLSDLVVQGSRVVQPPHHLGPWEGWDKPKTVMIDIVPDAIKAVGKFDLIDLDFCGPASSDMRKAMRLYRKMLAPRSVMLVTFSVGRDVEELGRQKLEEAKEWRDENDRNAVGHLLEVIPHHLLGRILLLVTPSDLWHLHSVIYYRGGNMPMCSILLKFGPVSALKTTFLKVDPSDFELAVCYPDSMSLYDCPVDRIKQLRQRHAALRAVLTRTTNTQTVETDDAFELQAPA